ncbi:MAG: O-Methyltransferase involved in polyketide biosynthesis [Oscillospiraceae bacterium]|nr:O-Methyltransferase involved in polyketide biosynthesis [Oscillospiraceae bacterium]
MKYHIERHTVQETLVIPLYARKVCMDRFPDLFADKACQELISKIDFDFESSGKKLPLFGALQGGIRQYDLCCEVRDYLTAHPLACVVNLGCGLDTTFSQSDNGTAKGYNLDMADVIAVRNELLPPGEREQNIPCDLNDVSWFEKLDFHPRDGAVFIAAGVFYYFQTEQIKDLLCIMANRFPGGRIVFDATTPFGVRLMRKTWIKEAGIQNVSTVFCVKDAEGELPAWSEDFKMVTRKKYLTGYRIPDKRWNLFIRLLFRYFDWSRLAQIVQIEFR